MAAALKAIKIEEFKHRSEQQKESLDRCVASYGCNTSAVQDFEGD